MKISNLFLTRQSADAVSQTIGIELDDQELECVSGGNSSYSQHNRSHPIFVRDNHSFGRHEHQQPFHPCHPQLHKKCY